MAKRARLIRHRHLCFDKKTHAAVVPRSLSRKSARSQITTLYLQNDPLVSCSYPCASSLSFFAMRLALFQRASKKSARRRGTKYPRVSKAPDGRTRFASKKAKPTGRTQQQQSGKPNLTPASTPRPPWSHPYPSLSYLSGVAELVLYPEDVRRLAVADDVHDLVRDPTVRVYVNDVRDSYRPPVFRLPEHETCPPPARHRAKKDIFFLRQKAAGAKIKTTPNRVGLAVGHRWPRSLGHRGS